MHEALDSAMWAVKSQKKRVMANGTLPGRLMFWGRFAGAGGPGSAPILGMGGGGGLFTIGVPPACQPAAATTYEDPPALLNMLAGKFCDIRFSDSGLGSPPLTPSCTATNVHWKDFSLENFIQDEAWLWLHGHTFSIFLVGAHAWPLWAKIFLDFSKVQDDMEGSQRCNLLLKIWKHSAAYNTERNTARIASLAGTASSASQTWKRRFLNIKECLLHWIYQRKV